MATAKEFERNRATFDRVELTTSVLGDRSFELSQEIDLKGAGPSTVVWVHDNSTGSVSWSTPIEELFGYEPGTPGFSVHGADTKPAVDEHLPIGPPPPVGPIVQSSRMEPLSDVAPAAADPHPVAVSRARRVAAGSGRRPTAGACSPGRKPMRSANGSQS